MDFKYIITGLMFAAAVLALGAALYYFAAW